MNNLKPEVVEIPFDSDRHRQVLDAVLQRYRMSKNYMSDRYTQWATMEERYRGYVNFKTNDVTRKQLRKEGRPQYVTIDIPYSYAMLLTAHTYWTSVFLSRSPTLQFQGAKGETQQQEQAVEAIIDYQVNAAHMLLPLYLWIMDAGKYGLGVLGNSWVEERSYVTQTVEVPRTFAGVTFGPPKRQRQTVEIKKYTGNKSFNIRPQDFFPDPRVPLHRLQEGEFVGRIVEVGWNTVLKRQQMGMYFNIDELQKQLTARRSEYRDRGSSQLVLPAGMDTLYYQNSMDDPTNKDKQKAFIELMEMKVELVPKDWGLGASPYPEKWVFTVGSGTVIIGCQPVGAYHQKFEDFVLEYEIEGYALNKRSMLEIVDPLNEVLTWLFNSHMYNVRKALNDQLVVDPSRLVMKDLTDPDAGRIVRLKPDAYGTDPKMAVHQLVVQDLTQGHLRDADSVMQLMQRVLGVTENVMGMLNQGGRRTATEVRTSSTFGINRLKTNAEYMSAMGFVPWATCLLQNTQQRYDGAEMFRIAGSQLTDAQQILVDKDAIAGEFQFIPIDGTMPVDRFAQANLWKEIMVAARSIPELAAGYNWGGIMNYIAQLNGMKNLDQFKINVVPDGSMGNAVQAGNSVPLNMGAMQGGNRSSGRGPANLTAIPGVGGVSGVGKTG